MGVELHSETHLLKIQATKNKSLIVPELLVVHLIIFFFFSLTQSHALCSITFLSKRSISCWAQPYFGKTCGHQYIGRAFILSDSEF